MEARGTSVSITPNDAPGDFMLLIPPAPDFVGFQVLALQGIHSCQGTQQEFPCITSYNCQKGALDTFRPRPLGKLTLSPRRVRATITQWGQRRMCWTQETPLPCLSICLCPTETMSDTCGEMHGYQGPRLLSNEGWRHTTK